MKKSPSFTVYDAANTLLLGAGNTEKEAVANAVKNISGPKRVTIHHTGDTYTKRTVILTESGIVGDKNKQENDQ